MRSLTFPPTVGSEHLVARLGHRQLIFELDEAACGVLHVGFDRQNHPPLQRLVDIAALIGHGMVCE